MCVEGRGIEKKREIVKGRGIERERESVCGRERDRESVVTQSGDTKG